MEVLPAVRHPRFGPIAQLYPFWLPAAIQRTLTALPQNQQGDIKFKRPVPAGLSDSLDQTLIIAGGNILAALLPLIIGEIRNLFSTNKSAGSHRESSISIRVSRDLPLDIDIDISIS